MSDKKIRETTVVKGYKVFDPDWTCDPTYINAKQYTCPGRFEEDLKPIVTKQGMHFCKNLTSCFSYYEFDPAKKSQKLLHMVTSPRMGIWYVLINSKSFENCHGMRFLIL